MVTSFSAGNLMGETLIKDNGQKAEKWYRKIDWVLRG
jgi:hypothetical protein